MKNYNLISTCILAISLALALSVNAEETKLEKVETGVNRASDSIKSSYRDVKDKTCKMFNGKLVCTEKKIINKTKNLSDKVKTDAKEIKNKID